MIDVYIKKAQGHKFLGFFALCWLYITKQEDKSKILSGREGERRGMGSGREVGREVGRGIRYGKKSGVRYGNKSGGAQFLSNNILGAESNWNPKRSI